MLHIGQVVRTSYGTGPFIIRNISEERTDPKFIDALNLQEKAPRSLPHRNFEVSPLLDPKKKGYFLNGYDENLRSVWSDDYLVICEVETLLLSLCL